ncbi:UNVERIFIED_CONTAM: hypothetical protein Sindi_2266400 [Sesamum indicum]
MARPTEMPPEESSRRLTPDCRDELLVNYPTLAIAKYDGTTDPQEHLSHFENAALLHSRKLQKTELNLFTVRQNDNELLKEYLQRFSAVGLEVPFAAQEVNASAFLEGLLDGDFFSCDETYQHGGRLGCQNESRGEKWKKILEEAPSKKPQIDFRDKKALL